MREAESPRRSILEDSFITFGDWAHEALKHPEHLEQSQWKPEPNIEMRFSRSRINVLRGALECCFSCWLLASFFKKEFLSLHAPPLDKNEDRNLEDLIHSQSEFLSTELTAAVLSTSVANSKMLFRIHTRADYDKVILSHENFDTNEFTEIPSINIEIRAPLGEISAALLPKLTLFQEISLSTRSHGWDMDLSMGVCQIHCKKISKIYSIHAKQIITDVRKLGVSLTNRLLV